MKYTQSNYSNFIKTLISALALALLVLTYYGYSSYTGSKVAYLIFTTISHSLLISGFTRRAFFIDLFVGVFFWLGFWFKFTIVIIYYDGIFNEPIGYFVRGPASYDQALLVASIGMGGFLLATLIRKKFLLGHFNNQLNPMNGLESMFKKNKVKILLFFIGLIVFIGVTNLFLGIYQKGTITKTFLPLGLNNLYKWLLLFGLASFSAVILDLEFRVRKKVSLILYSIAMFETFFTSISILSRGMVLNSAALIVGLLAIYRNKGKIIGFKSLFFGILVFLMFFVISQQLVGALRSVKFEKYDNDININKAILNQIDSRDYFYRNIFIDRWVGIEAVMAVSSHTNLGWDLLKDALDEKYDEEKMSFYDKNILKDKSPYINVDKSKHHFLSVPGIIAFFYYPGSYVFLFFMMLSIGVFSSIIEFIGYKLTQNLVLISLISQVIAYRYSNFGYVPLQNYLIFGAIIMNILLVYIGSNLYKHSMQTQT